MVQIMRGSRKFFHRGFPLFYLVNEWIQIQLKSGHHRHDGSPALNAGLVAMWFLGIRTSIAKKPYIFVIFQAGGGISGPPVPHMDPHMQMF